MAAPSKFTPEITRQICAALEMGCRRPDACAAANIDRKTFQLWLREGRRARSGPKRAFLDALLKAEATGRNFLLGLIRTAATKGQWQAAAWLLERRWPQWFGQNREAIKEILTLLRDGRKADLEIAALKGALPPGALVALGKHPEPGPAHPDAITTAPASERPDTRITSEPGQGGGR